MSSLGLNIRTFFIGLFVVFWTVVGVLSNGAFLLWTLGFNGFIFTFVFAVVLVIAVANVLTDDDKSLQSSVFDQTRRLGEWAGLLDSKIIVEGAIKEDNTIWVCRHRRNESTEAAFRACPHCRLELIERHVSGPVGREIIPDGGFTQDVLACPHCAYTLPGQKHEERGADAAIARFAYHIQQMRSAETGSVDHWYREARMVVGAPPTPSQVWDEYAERVTDDQVIRRTVDVSPDIQRQEAHTYDAFAELKRNRNQKEKLVEYLPKPAKDLVLEQFLTTYLNKKERIKRRRDKVRAEYRPVHKRVRTNHADTIEGLSNARLEREWPPDSITNKQIEAIQAEIESLGKLHREYASYLTGAEKASITHLQSQFKKAKEYAETARSLHIRLEDVFESVDQFELAYEPFVDRDCYLSKPDEKALDILLAEAEAAVSSIQLTNNRQAVEVPKLFEKEVRGLAHLIDLRRHQLDEYEESFIEAQVKRYPTVFNANGNELNPEQKRAVIRDEPHNLVDASAGTGKTLTLTQRFLYLYQTGTPLSKIVAITLTGDAADEMRSRLSTALDGISASRLNVHTIHALSRDIISRSIPGEVNSDGLKNGARRFLDRALSNDDILIEIAPEAMSTVNEHLAAAIETGTEELASSKQDSPESAARDRVRAAFKNARNFNRSPETLRAATDKGDLLEYHITYATAALLTVFEEYKSQNEKPVDHDHSISWATEVLDTYSTRYESAYDHVLVDEFQDVSEQTLSFIEQLIGPSTHLFAVGDDWQSIYGFQGSRPEFFRKFADRFGRTARTTLKTNYRSPASIVDASVALMRQSDQATQKTVTAESDDRASPQLHKLSGAYIDRSGLYISRLVRDIVTEPIEYNDVLVLTRNKKFGKDRIAPHLNALGIPTDVQDGRTDEPTNDEVGVVRVQTIHSAKGTQAKHVIVANAIDDQHGGIPQQDFNPTGIKPAMGETGNAFEEERRLFYVAITRVETSLHIITRADAVSRFVNDIVEYFEVTSDNTEKLEGKVVEIDRNEGRPTMVTVQSHGYDCYVGITDDALIEKLKIGAVYRFLNFELNYFGDMQEYLATDWSHVVRLQ